MINKGIRIAVIFAAAVLAVSTGHHVYAGQETAAEERMRTVETDKGEVEIPVNPQTIVSDYYLGEFFAVDVQPVIASPYSLSNKFLEDYVDGIQEI